MSVEGRIVVGTDGSVRAHRAVRWAAARAHQHGVGLAIVRVVPEHPVPNRLGALHAMGGGYEFGTHLAERVRRQLEEAQALALDEYPDLDVSPTVLQGHPVAALAGLASAAQLVVVGATGESGVSGLLLGGTAAGVVSHAQGPVVVVPEGTGDPHGPVVVGVDDTASAVDVARAARAEAAASGRDLLLVHTCDIDPTVESLAPSTYADDGEFARGFETMLTEMVERIDDDPPVPTTTTFVWGRAEQTLARESRTASLVVVGSRGRGGFAGLLLGSVSRSLVARAHCPTMVVHFPNT